MIKETKEERWGHLNLDTQKKGPTGLLSTALGDSPRNLILGAAKLDKSQLLLLE